MHQLLINPFLGAPDSCCCLARLTRHMHMRRAPPEPSAVSAGTSSMPSRAPTTDTIADSKQVGSKDGRNCTSAAARLPNSPASAPGLTCWHALQASLTAQSSPGSGAVLALLTVERHSSLLYHITKAWLGAHMRAALSQVGGCMVAVAAAAAAAPVTLPVPLRSQAAWPCYETPCETSM
jgi:hypothetical protein